MQCDLLIENAIIVPVEPMAVYRPGYLAVAGDSIAAVGEGSAAKDLEPRKRINGDGLLVMPGLVNAHTHVAMTLMRGYADDLRLEPWLQKKIWPLEFNLTAGDCYWGSLLGIVEMLKSGATTFNDMYHFSEATARAARDAGIRACPSEVLLSFLPDARERMERAFAEARQWNGTADGRIRPMFALHATYSVSKELMREVVEEAKRQGLRIHIHLSETAWEVEQSRGHTGKTPVEVAAEGGAFEPGALAAHCVHVDDNDIAILHEAGVGVSHNPTSNLKLASGFAPVVAMLRRGVTLGLGTDGAASNNNLDMWEELRLAALLHKAVTNDPTALPAAQALRMATLGGAEALGLAGEIGSLTVGKKADLILLDLRRPHLTPLFEPISHLVYCARADDVRTVIVNGRVLVEDGRCVTVNEEQAMAKAAEHAHALIERAQAGAERWATS
jgi:5-methylthioadenosine/S-adenosylhomocysteine deaminase